MCKTIICNDERCIFICLGKRIYIREHNIIIHDRISMENGPRCASLEIELKKAHSPIHSIGPITIGSQWLNASTTPITFLTLLIRVAYMRRHVFIHLRTRCETNFRFIHRTGFHTRINQSYYRRTEKKRKQKKHEHVKPFTFYDLFRR